MLQYVQNNQVVHSSNPADLLTAGRSHPSVHTAHVGSWPTRPNIMKIALLLTKEPHSRVN